MATTNKTITPAAWTEVVTSASAYFQLENISAVTLWYRFADSDPTPSEEIGLQAMPGEILTRSQIQGKVWMRVKHQATTGPVVTIPVNQAT